MALSIRRLAHTNSVARIPKPKGMTSVAGPGVTTMATPMSRTVKPTMATNTRLHCLTVFLISTVHTGEKTNRLAISHF